LAYPLIGMAHGDCFNEPIRRAPESGIHDRFVIRLGKSNGSQSLKSKAESLK
jgi:hypothetical protein